MPTAGSRGKLGSSARFCSTEQTIKGKFESYFIFHFNLSLTHQIFREPTIWSHCICPLGEVQLCIHMGCDRKAENRSREYETCQLPAFLPKDMNTSPFLGSFTPNSVGVPQPPAPFTCVLDPIPSCLSTHYPLFLSYIFYLKMPASPPILRQSRTLRHSFFFHSEPF